MTVACVASDEDAPQPIGVGDCHPQLPQADVLEFHVEFRARRFLHIGFEIEVLGRGPQGDWGVKEPGRAQVDAPEELPVALQFRPQDVVVGLARKALQEAVQAGRAKHQQHHQPVMVRRRLSHAGLLAHD